MSTSTANGAHVPPAVASRAASVRKAPRTYSAIFGALPGKATGLTVTFPPDDATGETLSVSCPVGTEPTEYDAGGVHDAIAESENVTVGFGKLLASGATVKNTKRPAGRDVADAVAEML